MFVIPCVVKSCSLWSSYGKPTIVHCNSEDKASMSIFHLSIVIYLQSHYYSACISFFCIICSHFYWGFRGGLGGGGGRRLGVETGRYLFPCSSVKSVFSLVPPNENLDFLCFPFPWIRPYSPVPQNPWEDLFIMEKIKIFDFFFKPMNKIKLGTWIVLTNCIESWQNLEDFFLLGNIPGKNDFLKAVHIHWWFGSIISYSAYKLGFGAL